MRGSGVIGGGQAQSPMGESPRREKRLDAVLESVVGHSRPAVPYCDLKKLTLSQGDAHRLIDRVPCIEDQFRDSSGATIDGRPEGKIRGGSMAGASGRAARLILITISMRLLRSVGAGSPLGERTIARLRDSRSEIARVESRV